jgi:chemotaxis protein histidine kinase CheA
MLPAGTPIGNVELIQARPDDLIKNNENHQVPAGNPVENVKFNDLIKNNENHQVPAGNPIGNVKFIQARPDDHTYKNSEKQFYTSWTVQRNLFVIAMIIAVLELHFMTPGFVQGVGGLLSTFIILAFLGWLDELLQRRFGDAFVEKVAAWKDRRAKEAFWKKLDAQFTEWKEKERKGGHFEAEQDRAWKLAEELEKIKVVERERAEALQKAEEEREARLAEEQLKKLKEEKKRVRLALERSAKADEAADKRRAKLRKEQEAKRRKAEEEAEKLREEKEMARKKAEEEEAEKLREEKEMARKKAEEEKAEKLREEKEMARKKAEEEEAAKLASAPGPKKRTTRLDPTSPNSTICGPEGLVNLTRAAKSSSSIYKSRPAPPKSATHRPNGDGLVDLNKATKSLPKSSVYGSDGLVNRSKGIKPRPANPEPSNMIGLVELNKATKSLPKSSVYGSDGLVNLSKGIKSRPANPEPSININRVVQEKVNRLAQEKAEKKARREAALARAAAERQAEWLMK